MSTWEIVRMACYVVSVPTLLYLTLHSIHNRSYSFSALYGGLAMLLSWYVVEITIASTGINTREYRVIGTPLVIVIAASLLSIASGIVKGGGAR